MSLLKAGQFDGARKVSKELCKANRRDPESWYLLALSLSQLKEYPEAIKTYKKTLELAPHFAEAAFNLALTYQLTGRLADAVTYYRRTIKLNPSLADAHYNLGNMLFVQEKYQGAAECYKSAIRLKPDHVDARINLAVVLQKQGDFDSAENMLQSVASQSNSPVAWHSLGQLYQTRKEYQRAINTYLRAIEVKPDFAGAWFNLGKSYETLGQYNSAMSAYETAAQHDPNNVEALYEVASVCFQSGRFNKAKEYLKKTLAIDSKHIKSHVSKISIKVVFGDVDEALVDIDKALEIDASFPDAIILKAKIYEQMGKAESALDLLKPLMDQGVFHAAAGSVYANICYGQKKYREGITYLEGLLENGNHQNWGLRQIHFSLGKLYDGIAEYNSAFRHYKNGNDLKTCNYSAEDNSNSVDMLMRAFPFGCFDELARVADETCRPLFIVGMPRSGTSLVEQILSCHPCIAPGGELTFVHDAARTLKDRLGSDMPYPGCVQNLTAEVAESIAEDYARLTASLKKDETFVTDKLPGNYWHLGLISLLFPSAKIIHCRRNPVDTCLSCYFQDFSGDLPFSYNLEHLAHTYEEYLRIMAHWNQVLELPMLAVDYEDLIQSQESESRRIIEFCGLEWAPTCLDFNRAERFVRTASYDQVRRPIYKSSMGRWRNYEAYIGPLKRLLD